MSPTKLVFKLLLKALAIKIFNPDQVKSLSRKKFESPKKSYFFPLELFFSQTFSLNFFLGSYRTRVATEELDNKIARFIWNRTWKSFLKCNVEILSLIFMSNSRQFKPGAELCQAKTSIYRKQGLAEAAYYAQANLISKRQLNITFQLDQMVVSWIWLIKSLIKVQH